MSNFLRLAVVGLRVFGKTVVRAWQDATLRAGGAAASKAQTSDREKRAAQQQRDTPKPGEMTWDEAKQILGLDPSQRPTKSQVLQKYEFLFAQNDPAVGSPGTELEFAL